MSDRHQNQTNREMEFIMTSTEGLNWILKSHREEESDGGMKDEEMSGNSGPCRTDSVTVSNLSKTLILLSMVF